MRSKAFYVYVSPNQQYGWLLIPHHNLSVAVKVNRHWSKEMEKTSYLRKRNL